MTAQANEIAIGGVGYGATFPGDTAQWSTAPTTNWVGLGTGVNWPEGAGNSLSAAQVAYDDVMSSEAALTLGGTVNTAVAWGVAFMTFEGASSQGQGLSMSFL
jgi:hypothetical protein